METQSVKFDYASLKPSNPTEEVILNNLGKRERFRRETNLSAYQVNLLRKGEKIVDEQFLATWKKWESLGLGSIIYGRKGNATRFKWNYNLKWVAKAAMEGEKAGEPEALPGAAKRGRGRPPGSKNKRREVMAPRVKTDVKDMSMLVLNQVLQLAKDAQQLIKTIHQVEHTA